MTKTLNLAALIAAITLCACATTEPAATTEQVSQREYPTGSNIPRKRGENDGVKVYDAEALERARNETPTTARGGLGRTQ